MANQKKGSAKPQQRTHHLPVFTVCTGKENRTETGFLSDVLNYVDSAGIRQIQVIYNACGQRLEEYLAKQPWQVKSHKVGRAAI